MNNILDEIIAEIYSFVREDKCHFNDSDDYNPYYDGMLAVIPIIENFKNREDDLK